MDVVYNTKLKIINAAKELAAEGIIPSGLNYENVTVEIPKDTLHGELSSNVAMVISKSAGLQSRDIAKFFVEKMNKDLEISKAEIAGPGFINFKLEIRVWDDILKAILLNGRKFGFCNFGNGERVNLEFVSANPTGPLHVGHTRGAVFGDVLGNLLEYVGYAVTREYYVNDAGSQVDVLAQSVFLRYKEALGYEVEFDLNSYPGDYLVPLGEELRKKYGNSLVIMNEPSRQELIKKFSISAMMDLIKLDLSKLGVVMDSYFSEKSLYDNGTVEAAVKQLDKLGLIYTGVLPPPKGKELNDWEPRRQELFKSTKYGDDVDRPIKKFDGTWTYFAPDIAYHYDKLQRGFDEIIDVFGADHSGYVSRMRAVISAFSDNQKELKVKLCQLVKLYKNNKPFKMSKRSGSFVTLSDLLNEVGPEVVRYTLLMRKNDAPIDFDFEKVLEQSKDNPVFYVQYAHARTVSIFKYASENGFEVNDDILAISDFGLLSSDLERLVVRKLGEWPNVLRQAAASHEPHRLAFYLYDLAATFHSLQHKGKLDGNLRFVIKEAERLSFSRLALVRSLQIVIQSGLRILGIEPRQEME